MEIGIMTIFGLFILFVVLITIILYMRVVGGGYLKARISSQLWYRKGKGIWVEYNSKAGKVTDRYIIAPQSANIIDFNKKDKFFLDKCSEQLFDDTGNLVPAKEARYGIPLYRVFEGSPTNVLPVYRDFEQDINYFDELIKTMTDIIETKNYEMAYPLIDKINEKCTQLHDAFKYLPAGKKIVISLLNIPLSEKDEEGNETHVDGIKILKEYKLHIEALKKVLKVKSKTLVTFTDYFNHANLAELINNIVPLAYTFGLLEGLLSKKREMLLLILIIAGLIIGFLVMGIMLSKQGKTIKEMSANVNNVYADMNRLMDYTFPITDTGLNDLNMPNSPYVQTKGVNG